MDCDPQARLTRRELVARAGGAGLVLLGGAAVGRLLDPPVARAADAIFRPADSDGGGYLVFRSQPDLRPPNVTVLRRTPAASPGCLFLAPNAGPGQRGVMILDERGDLVWFRRTFPQTAMDFRAAVYRGRPVLTWWEGKAGHGLGVGEHVIVDDAYREVARFPAGRGRQSDLHELQLTRRGTAYVTSYERRGNVVGGIVQELDVPSARVRFEWNSFDHVDVSESQVGPGGAGFFDYFHVNSVDVDDDGDLLVSARNTWALYKVDRQTGRVRWRLGGKRSDFHMGPGTSFAWQHDARHHGPYDRLISVFDDGAAPAVEDHSRALLLDVDQRARTVTLRREFRHSRQILAAAMGNAQLLPNGAMFVGWGTEPYLTEFDAHGRIVFDARLPHGGENYRAFRLPWVGRPADGPRLAARSTTAGRRLYASWNGATEVASWQLRTGRHAGDLQPEATGPKRSFETVLTASRGTRWAAVAALDAHGRELGVSNVVRL